MKRAHRRHEADRLLPAAPTTARAHGPRGSSSGSSSATGSRRTGDRPGSLGECLVERRAARAPARRSPRGGSRSCSSSPRRDRPGQRRGAAHCPVRAGSPTTSWAEALPAGFDAGFGEQLRRPTPPTRRGSSRRCSRGGVVRRLGPVRRSRTAPSRAPAGQSAGGAASGGRIASAEIGSRERRRGWCPAPGSSAAGGCRSRRRRLRERGLESGERSCAAGVADECVAGISRASSAPRPRSIAVPCAEQDDLGSRREPARGCARGHVRVTGPAGDAAAAAIDRADAPGANDREFRKKCLGGCCHSRSSSLLEIPVGSGSAR